MVMGHDGQSGGEAEAGGGTKTYREKLEWQIGARQRIQCLLLEMYDFLEFYPEFPREADHHPYWMQMCWMVDASFSLWRSAFLTDTPRDREVIYDHMKEFIRKVVEQNAISFADDHRMRTDHLHRGPSLRLWSAS